MEYTEELQESNEQFLDMIYNDMILIKGALIIVGCAALFFLFFALYKKIRRHWESTCYMLLCVSILFWIACSLVAFFYASPEQAVILNQLRFAGIIPIPALLCMHVRQQISYKEENPGAVILFFIVATFLILILVRSLFFPQIFYELPALADTDLYHLIFYVYAIIALIRAYLLCFSVFYQMPKRTRRSTHLMLVGISSIALLIAIYALLTSQFADYIPQSMLFEIIVPLGGPAAFIILLYPLYSALHIMPASDVIVTSREFVMGGLDTTVLVMTLKKQILDWNRNDWGTGFPLPKPLYREPFDIYRKRVLDLPSCRVSPHSEDIIIVLFGEKELHLLVRVHPAGTGKRTFGYVVEISDVTAVYTLLRYFEEIAYYDTLTGLHNRNAYFDYVERNVIEEKMPLVIFVGDVNYLKKLNDNHGHLVGDELLKTVADVIMKSMPHGAFVARAGGDEFIMIVPNGSEDIADRFVRNMIAACEGIDHEVFGSPSISWGYSIMYSTSQSYNEVFEKADKMMYEFKKLRHDNKSSGYVTGKLENRE